MGLKTVLLCELAVISTLTVGLMALTAGSSLHCSMRREISPCTCAHLELNPGLIQVTCEKIESFGTIVNALQDKFDPETQIVLKIAFSGMRDFGDRGFEQLGLTIINLKLNYNNLSEFSEDSFAGLNRVESLSLADNELTEVPRHVLRHMPLIKILDLSRDHIQNLTSYDFKSLPLLQSLILQSNNISYLENGSLPPTLRYLHLGANSLSSLNGALRGLTDLVWLLLSENGLQNIDYEFPDYLPKLSFLTVTHNALEKLPDSFKFAPSLDMLLLHHNRVTSLNGSLSQARMLRELDISHNLIESLSPHDFLEQENLEDLQIGFNQLTALNGSLLPLRSLRYLNLTHNRLEEFSLQDIRGLKQLRIVDLSHNKIVRLGGKMETLVDLETRVYELKLEHNELETLDGSLSGIQGLQRLNVSHNKLSRIAAGGLMGLENLRMLDISHNMLTTLEETARTFLPSLEELIAHNNALTLLERDFHGLPVLCWADLGHNQIHTVHLELIEKTQCKLYGVNSTLKIYLHGNPVLCNEEMKRVFSAMETKNKSKIHGFEATDCSTMKTTVATTPMITTPSTLETTAQTTTTATTTISTTTELPLATSTVITTETESTTSEPSTTSTTSIPSTTTTTQPTTVQTSQASPVIFSYTETIRPMYNYIEDTTTESAIKTLDSDEEKVAVTQREETTLSPVSSTITYEVVQPVVVIAAPLDQVVNAVNSAEVNQTVVDPVSITVSVA